jgi:hypothetical protein
MISKIIFESLVSIGLFQNFVGYIWQYSGFVFFFLKSSALVKYLKNRQWTENGYTVMESYFYHILLQRMKNGPECPQSEGTEFHS